MSDDAAYTIEQLQRLRRAMAAGVRQVSHNGRTTVFASLAEMRSLERQMEIALGLVRPRRSMVHYISFDRGDGR